MASDTSKVDDKNTSRWTSWFAAMILLAFFGFYGLALLSGIFSSPDDYSGVEKVASTLGPIIATVIGFYFGQRPVGTLADKLQDAAATTGVAKQGVQKSLNISESTREETDRLKKIIARQDELIAELRKGKLVKEGKA
jgi:hypothetical protein